MFNNIPIMQELSLEKRITSLDMHKAIVHPLRISILEQLVHQSYTAKELAGALQLQLTKLYYHLNLLERFDIIRVVQTRLVSGILERTYRATARNYVLDRQTLFRDMSEGELHEWVEGTLHSVWDATRDHIKEGVFSKHIDPSEEALHRKLLLMRCSSRMSPGRATEFHTRLTALMNEFEQDYNEPDHPEALPYTLTVAYFPNDPSLV